ncbi:hypothetical protein PMAYCL1PPCAC_20658, partial [Pristionchus mayeri]
SMVSSIAKSMSSSHDINLLNLNSDVIQIIAKISPGNSTSMQMISPRWNNIVKNHLSKRTNRPIINAFIFGIQPMLGQT